MIELKLAPHHWLVVAFVRPFQIRYAMRKWIVEKKTGKMSTQIEQKSRLFGFFLKFFLVVVVYLENVSEKESVAIMVKKIHHHGIDLNQI